MINRGVLRESLMLWIPACQDNTDPNVLKQYNACRQAIDDLIDNKINIDYFSTILHDNGVNIDNYERIVEFNLAVNEDYLIA